MLCLVAYWRIIYIGSVGSQKNGGAVHTERGWIHPVHCILPSIEDDCASKHLSPSFIDVVIALLQIFDSAHIFHPESFISDFSSGTISPATR
jgi:hypothetical protein